MYADTVTKPLKTSKVSFRRSGEGCREHPYLTGALIAILLGWIAVIIFISLDPWIYFNGYRDDFITWEARFLLALVVGTPIGILVFLPLIFLGVWLGRHWKERRHRST